MKKHKNTSPATATPDTDDRICALMQQMLDNANDLIAMLALARWRNSTNYYDRPAQSTTRPTGTWAPSCHLPTTLCPARPRPADFDALRQATARAVAEAITEAIAQGIARAVKATEVATRVAAVAAAKNASNTAEAARSAQAAARATAKAAQNAAKAAQNAAEAARSE